MAAGNYAPSSRSDALDPRSARFQLKNGVRLYGGFLGNEASLTQRDFTTYRTYLTGEIGDSGTTSDNIYNVVYSAGNDNTAVLDGFVVTAANGASGMHIESSSPVVTNCDFWNNTSSGGGGGVSHNRGTPVFINCRFLNNAAVNGGGLFQNGSPLYLINCVFSRNVAVKGGGVYVAGDTRQYMINCAVGGNICYEQGAGVLIGWGCTLEMRNSAIWSNSGGWEIFAEDMGHMTYSYSIKGSNMGPTYWTTDEGGNMEGDPGWINQAGADGIMGTLDDDYRLSSGSGCIDAGSNSYVGYQVDLDRHCRRFDRNSGPAPVVDIGPYEFGSSPITQVLYVKSDAVGKGIGTSWADAFTDLNTALTTALVSRGPVSEIWVAGGAYKPTSPSGNRSVSFALLTNLGVYGGFSGTETARDQRDPAAHLTVLSGDLNGNDGPDYANNGENGFHVVTASGTNASAILDGFTISGGNSNGAAPNDRGAGLYSISGQPALRNIRFINNSSGGQAGAMYLETGRAELGGVTVDRNAGPLSSGAIAGNQSYLTGPLWLTGGTQVAPVVLDLRSSRFEGTGGIALDLFSKLSISSAPLYDPVVIRTNVTGTGSIEIAPGQELVLEGNACVDLRQPGSGTPCLDAGGTRGGDILIDGTLLVRDTSSVRNANISVRQADVKEGSDIQYNNIFMVDAINSGGEFFVEGNATIANNVITSVGDRYLDLDPNPAAAQHPTIDQNIIHVQIETNPALAQGTLLELRAGDGECGTPVNPDCRSGALPTSIGGRFDAEPAQNWVLESLEIKPGAKLNLTNRPGFQFHPGSAHPETAYIRMLKLHPNAVLNTALQTLYYESLVDENGTTLVRDPAHPDALLANGSQIVDVPLLGFSLGIIAMNDTTASPFNEFDIRVHQRVHDSGDVQPDPPAPALEGIIQRLPDGRDPVSHDGVMEMATRGPAKATASSVAAKGSFARAGDEDITVIFEYLFMENADAELIVKLSDKQDVGTRSFEVARVKAPASGRPGAIGSGQFGVFYGTFPRVTTAYSLNFVRGTYVELELRGDHDAQGNTIPPVPSRVWIDNFDPQIRCSYQCADLSGEGSVTNRDFMLALAEAGQTVAARQTQQGARWIGCMDNKLAEDGYVDISDILAFDSVIRIPAPPQACGPFNPPSPSPAPMKSLARSARAASQLVQPAGSGDPVSLVVAGKSGAQADGLYSLDKTSGAATGCPQNPIGGAGSRSNGRVIRDGGAPDARYLPDGQCYTITIGTGAVSPNPTGDTNVNVRALAGDTTMNGQINLGDALYVKTRLGQALNSGTARFDVDLSGAIGLPDLAWVKSRISSPAAQVVCP